MSENLSENIHLQIERKVEINAPAQTVFDAILEQMGSGMEGETGQSLNMVIEAKPGGRWFRDLGEGQGHLWAHVQAIKPPNLLEFTGPLFMSSPTSNNVMYRLTENDGTTMLTFTHTAFGPMAQEVEEGVTSGWNAHLEAIAKACS